jgi:hypothetical protein
MWTVLGERRSALSLATHSGMPSAGVCSPGAEVSGILMPSLSARCLTRSTTASWLDGESWLSALTAGSRVLSAISV